MRSQHDSGTNRSCRRALLGACTWTIGRHRLSILLGTLLTVLGLGMSVDLSGQNRQAPQISLTGTLDVLIVDYVEPRRPEMAYFIREDARGRVFELKFDSFTPGQLRTGQARKALRD